jgi:galactose mutarotase-like enzyme
VSEVTVDDGANFRGYRQITLENESLHLKIFPEIGARIYEIKHVPTGVNVLWRNPRIPLQKAPFGSRFDDVWAGGWDEVFPNDQESTVSGEHYPDMGELWSLPWEYETDQRRNSASVTTKVVTPISPAEITRRITLEKGSSSVTCDYHIRNLSADEMHFLWKIHVAFAINDRCSMDIPAKRAVVDPRFQHFFEDSSYEWPLARMKDSTRKDMSRVRLSDHNCTCQYLTELDEGRVDFRDGEHGLVSRMTFPKEVLNNVWLFLDYGGWRNGYLAAIEPSTSYPHDLAEIIRQKRSASLDGNGKLSAQVKFSVEPMTEGSR